MIFSKKNAGKWVASKDGKVIAVDTRLSTVLQKVKGYNRDAIQLDLVPTSSFLAGSIVGKPISANHRFEKCWHGVYAFSPLPTASCPTR